MLILWISGIAAICVIAAIAILKLKNRNNKMSFRESLDLTDLPIVTFYNGDKKLNFLLDTGSNSSFINERDLKKLEPYSVLDDNIGSGLVTGSGVSDTKCNHIEGTLMYKGFLYKEIFAILDLSESFDDIKRETGVSIHGILGNSFFIRYRYILNFDEMIAYHK